MEIDTEIDIKQFAVSEIEGKCGELSVEAAPSAEPSAEPAGITPQP